MENRILVVDDDPAVRDMLRDLFMESGYAPILAETAEQGLVLMEQQNPQVMFFDLKLPGMNGLELCREVRKSNAIAVVYAMTGHTSFFELSDCREAGFDDYFVKPVENKAFLKAAAEGFEKLARWKRKKKE